MRHLKTRTLPSRPSLTELRKQARELLRSYRAGTEAAVAEVEQREQGLVPARFTLDDAQRVLARAYGHSSWARLTQHVEGVHFEGLLAAAEAGDVSAVRQIAAVRPELLKPHLAEFRDSALHRAVLLRHEELTRVLMQLGADARTGIWPHREATSAYAIAVDREYAEIVAAIEQEEANRRKQLGASETCTATAVDLLQQAITAGRAADAIALMEADPALVSVCDVDGVTPLHLAAWKHDAGLVCWLLDQGASPGALALCADPIQRDPAESGKTPLDFAAIVAGWPSEGCGPRLPFMENAHLDPGHFHETAGLLLLKGAALTPRAAAALGDREAMVRRHREGGLLNEIHMFRGGLLAVAVRVNRPDLLATLLDLGLDPDESVVTDDDARSWGMPLWFASMCGRHEMAELLLARGADVNAIVYACGDALCMAADEKMENILRQHGARLTVEQVTDPKIAQAILDGTVPAYSLNVDEPTQANLAEQMLCSAGGNPEFVRICLPHITRPRNDPWWNDVLFHARMPEGLRLILEHGVDLDVRGDGGYTILHHLASNQCEETHRIVRANMLLEAGASLSIRDTLLQSTPLGWACRWGRTALVRLYLNRGADPTESTAPPWATALAWARKHGHAEVVELLRSHGASEKFL
jgi:ankyrin repeat protein